MPWDLAISSGLATARASLPGAPGSPLRTAATLGGSGSVSSTRSASDPDSPRTRCGARPHKSRYSATPSAYTSLAVVTGSPRTCSGDAYSGASMRTPVRVRGGSSLADSSSSFAMPKSSSFGSPASVTRMFEA